MYNSYNEVINILTSKLPKNTLSSKFSNLANSTPSQQTKEQMNNIMASKLSDDDINQLSNLANSTPSQQTKEQMNNILASKLSDDDITQLSNLANSTPSQQTKEQMNNIMASKLSDDDINQLSNLANSTPSQQTKEQMNNILTSKLSDDDINQLSNLDKVNEAKSENVMYHSYAPSSFNSLDKDDVITDKNIDEEIDRELREALNIVDSEYNRTENTENLNDIYQVAQSNASKTNEQTPPQNNSYQATQTTVAQGNALKTNGQTPLQNNSYQATQTAVAQANALKTNGQTKDELSQQDANSKQKSSQKPIDRETEKRVVKLAVDSIIEALLRITNYDVDKTNAAMDLLGSGLELPSKLDNVVNVVQEKFNPVIFKKAIEEINKTTAKNKDLVKSTMRHTYGKDGNKLVSWR